MPRKKIELNTDYSVEIIFNLYNTILKTQVSANTFNNYIKTVKHFLNFLHQERNTALQDATSGDILLFISKDVDSNKSTKKSAKRYLSAIKSFYQYCVANQHLITDQASLINTNMLKIRGRQLPNDIPVKYIESFLTHCQNEDEKIISEFIFNTGCRNAEASSIQTENIDFESNTVKLTEIRINKNDKILYQFSPKSGYERLLYMTKGFTQKLKNYVESIRPRKKTRSEFNKFLFISDKGNNYTDQRIRKFFRLYRKKVAEELELSEDQEKKIKPHALRHTLGTQLSKKEVGIKQIRDQLGHRSIESTLIYTGDRPTKINSEVQKKHPMN